MLIIDPKRVGNNAGFCVCKPSLLVLCQSVLHIISRFLIVVYVCIVHTYLRLRPVGIVLSCVPEWGTRNVVKLVFLVVTIIANR